MLRFVSTILVLAAAGVGCKQRHDASEVQSLDNFARGSGAALSQNSCHGGYDLIEDLFSPDLDMVNIHEAPGQTLDAMQTRVESALRAVPTEVQVAFFGVGGIVEVTPEAHNICAQKLDDDAKKRLSEGGDRIKGCWKYQTDQIEDENGTKEADPRVVIYIDTDAGSIEHALVRTFGYVLSQVLVKLDKDGDQPRVRTVQSDPKFEEAKEKITLAFLKDVGASNGRYDLKRHARLLGTDVVSADQLARSTGWQQLKTQRPDAARAFADYVFAETFDSFYCSTQTKDVLTRDFRQTGTEFQPVAEAITGMAAELAEVQGADEILQKIEEGKDQVTPVRSGDRPSTDDGDVVQKTEISLGGAAFGLRFFGGFFRGVGRVIGAIGRGVFYGARAVVQGVARVAVGAVRFGAAVVRGTARVVGAVFRGAARVARGIVVGTGRLIGAAARAVVAVGRVVVRGAGRVVRGIFGEPIYFATEPGVILEPSPLGDQDGDGIEDAADVCSKTQAGASVHQIPEWLGCAEGQQRDR